VGWYLGDGSPGIYTNPMPIWSDTNLDHLGKALRSRLWLANVRSATRGLPVNQANTHPFLANGMLFSHNGFVNDFTVSLRGVVREALNPAYESSVRGSTDSEYLFALLRQEMLALPAPQAIRSVIAQLDGWLGDNHALLNFLLCDGKSIFATRHALRHVSPSLYFGRDEALFGDGWLVASEPLSGAADWRPVPDHHPVIIAGGAAPRVQPP